MLMLARNPAEAYARVDLDARIEAAGGAELTRICLEEAVASLGRAMLALERKPHAVPREALIRAHSIALHLARSVPSDNPLREALVQFYGGQAEAIGRNMRQANAPDISRIRDDFADLLEAASAA